MAAAAVQSAKSSTPFHKPSNQRLNANSPIPSASSSRSTQTPELSSSPPETSSRTFHRIRSTLEQSLRTATRSKKLPPPPPVDEFATLGPKSNGKGKEKAKEKEREETPQKEKEKLNVLRRVTFRRGDRETPSPVPPNSSEKGRIAGFTSFMTPSLRQASMSSPTLHLSSQAHPSPRSQPPVPGSSSSNADALASPSRHRSRRTSTQQSREISAPGPLSILTTSDPAVVRKGHRSSKSHPPGIPPSPSSPSLHHPPRDTPTHSRAYRDREPATPPATPTPTSRGQASRSPSSKTSSSPTPASPRASSPHRPISPSAARVRVVTPPARRLTSASATHLPLSAPDATTPPPTPRRPSADASRRPMDPPSTPTRRPSTAERDSHHPRPSRESPSPSPIRPRAISPVQRSYAQNRHFNISSGSLIAPPTSPESRELIRTATSMICREMVKPPVHVSRTEQGVKDWEEVEVRIRALARLERIWGKSGAGSSSTNVSTPGMTSSGEERERKLFCEALRDGYVLCQLMNKLRSSSVVRPDAREDGIVRTTNVTRFLAACASYGLPNEDLFQRDDLLEGTSDSLARVAKTVIALIRFVDSPAPSRLKYIYGQGHQEQARPSGASLPYGQATLSRASASTPNLLSTQGLPHPPMSPTRKRWSPPSDLPPLRSDSPDTGSSALGSESPSVRPRGDGRRRSGRRRDEEEEVVGPIEADGGGHDVEVRPVKVPHILKPPPRSPLRKPSNKCLNADAAGLASWAKAAASPASDSGYSHASSSVPPVPPMPAMPSARSSVADSTRASIGDASIRDSIGDLPYNLRRSHPSGGNLHLNTNHHYGGYSNARQSVASTAMSETTVTTAVSSILDGGRSSSGGNMFGTIRTMTTDLTSEAPSVSRTEGSFIVEELARKRSMEVVLGSPGGANGKYGHRERKMSETPLLDLSRVAEETEESVSSKGHGHGRVQEARLNESSKPQAAVHLRKGKWPDDFIDAFQVQSQAQSIPAAEDSRQSTPVSLSPPKKLAIVGARRPEGDPLAQFPRRPSHRPRPSLDSPGLLPKESLLRRDASPDSTASSSGRVMVRRQSTKPGLIGGRPSNYVPRSNLDEPATPTSDTPPEPLVPFPRSVSGEYGTPSPRSSTGDGFADRPRLLRGRFQSEIDGSSAKRRARPSSSDDLGGKSSARSRFESMVNLGVASGSASASDLMSRDSMDGSAVKTRLVVREDGKPPTHFQLGNCIGRGQFGSVYRALNLNTGQMVAVKRIRLEGLKEEEVTTLMREVDLVKSLSHPSIVKYEGMVRDDDTLNIILEYAENGSLGQTVKSFGPLNERLVAGYVVKILEGLHYLHTSDVVHCDLKAANILTTKNGNVKLSDFGVSLNLRAMEREIKDVAGTPNWMAPEVIELKGASTKSDIWSLGCTVIELLTGRPPYAEIANSMSVMFRIVEDPMPPLPDGCSELLKEFLEQCFDKDPTQRPSAEMLCEHPWLKKNWVAMKELRPKDSIPFLRRVSTDLQKVDALRLLSQLEVPETPVSASPGKHDDVGRLTPNPRRASASSTRPGGGGDNDFSPREHSFVKTTFSKPMVCRVCLSNVKKSAVLCSQCSLISHSKCAPNAPPTCDLRSQLLLYAQYAEKGNPLSAYSNPAETTNDNSQNVAMSDVPFIDHNTPRTSIDSPRTPQNAAVEHAPTAFKFMAAFKRSRSNLSPEPTATSSPHVNSPTKEPEEKAPRRRPPPPQKLSERPLSVTSTSTGLSSLRSAATAAESFSSRQNTSGRSQLSSNDGRRPFSASAIPNHPRSSKMTTSARSEATTDYDDDVRPGDFPGSLPPADPRKQKKRGTSSGNCMVQ